jgi:hypothetical protein
MLKETRIFTVVNGVLAGWKAKNVCSVRNAQLILASFYGCSQYIRVKCVADMHQILFQNAAHARDLTTVSESDLYNSLHIQIDAEANVPEKTPL